MPHIFISYAKQDTRELALHLCDSLNRLENVTAWVDRSLRAGRSWELQIQNEIDRCDVVIVLYSPDINRHKQGKPESYVLTEIAYAKWTAKKLIIPVMAQRTDPPISLTMEHYIDFTLDGLDLDDLVTEICHELGIPVQNPKLAGFENPVPKIQPEVRTTDILPAPFEWIEIPVGSVTIEGKIETIPTFHIAKYPITNAQYAKFIEAGGYIEKKWWTDAGWQQREKDSWIQPRYWLDSKWNGDEQPVVGVSWYEAVAYCQWLSEMTDQNISLPTEQQWQQAAQGDDGRIYPWGDDWDCARCNNSVKPCVSNQTTPVRQYEGKGDSFFKVVDMAGNTWEWCRTAYETGSQDLNGTYIRVLKGCSWDFPHIDLFRCDDRSRDEPNFGGDGRGFRVSRS